VPIRENVGPNGDSLAGNTLYGEASAIDFRPNIFDDDARAAPVHGEWFLLILFGKESR
jgi:hypothetical protein